MSKTLDEYRQQYAEEESDPYPEKPPRVWVNTLRGKATRRGRKYIKDSRAWEIRFLTWFHNEIVQ